MSTVIPHLLLIGLGASVSPVAVMLLISVMLKKNPRRNSLLFILGYTAALVALGVVVVYIFHLGGGGGTHKIDGFIDLSLGAICFLAVPYSLRKKDRKRAPGAESGLTAFRSFSLGSMVLLLNPSTYLIFISGLHAISVARLGRQDVLLAIAFLTLVTLVTLLIPIIIFFVIPRTARKVLDFLKAWLTKHNRVIGVAVLLIFGVYLLTKGLRILL